MIYHTFTAAIIAYTLAFTPVVFGQHEGHGTHTEHEGHSMDHGSHSMESAAQTTCPVSGEAINKDSYTDYNGKRVYFCCDACKAEFAKEPEKILSKLKTDGVTLETISVMQTKCPVMGGDIDKSLYAEHDGKRVYFCCPMCKPRFEEDPTRYIKQMEDKGIELTKVKQSE